MVQTEVFEARVGRFEGELRVVNGQLDRIAWLRLLVFVVGVTLEVVSWSWGGFWWVLMLAPLLVGFGLLVKWNVRVQRKKQFVELLIQINREEPGRLEGNAPHGDGGLVYADKEHAYTGDLDVFGARSLFALLDRSATSFGRKALAGWLKAPADRGTVLGRQVAARELAGKVDFRQMIEAEGRMPGKAQLDPEGLRAWLEEAPTLSQHAVYPKAGVALPVITLGMGVLALLGLVPGWAFWGMIGVHLVILRPIFKLSKRLYYQTDRMAGALKTYAELLERLEGEELVSPMLVELKGRIQTEGRPAHVEISALVGILGRLELRMNGLMYAIMNTLFLWDIHAIVALEGWKKRHSGRVLPWFEAIGEFEAVAGMAGLHYGRPGWVFAEVVEGAFVLEGEEVGHPLIPDGQRVANPVSLAGPGRAWLVTGSNMSGKSTYLRTVGVNALLGLVGAPVCAKWLRVSEMAIAASMRTADSLEENTSSFYAELKRLKQVIATVESGRATLFLLDEILKGTNSKDRHAGARALIRQLVQGGGSGLVSTHDLELQDLVEVLPGQVVNYSFNCDVGGDGKLHFDYRLRDGVCQSMNATALMRAMGISV